MSGWIKINRKINEHWLWKDAEKFQWWIDLLLMAAWKDKKEMHDSHLIKIKKGQMIISISDLCKRWNKSKPTIISFLKMLQEDGMIKRETLYRQTPLLTICNYERYQSKTDSIADTLLDILVDTLVDTPNNIEEYKEDSLKESLKKAATIVASKRKEGMSEKEKQKEHRKKEFYAELVPYVERYGKDMVREFYNYWSEDNKSHTQFRKELEKTWDTERRLETWARNQDKRNSNGNSREPQTTAAQRAQDVASLIARLGEKNKPFEG